MHLLPTAAHRYLAGAITRDEYLAPVVCLGLDRDAAIALGDALGALAAELWLDGRLEL